MIKHTRQIMGMPITVMVHDNSLNTSQIEQLFEVFYTIDKRYSPYRKESEVSQLQTVPLFQRQYSPELAHIMTLAEKTKRQTNDYFDVEHNGVFDPSGIVKGWALQKAAELLATWTPNFYIEAGGDIQVQGVSEHNTPWVIGVRNPFERTQNVAIVTLDNAAIATSGTAIRGDHIYDPVTHKKLDTVVSLTVVAPHIIDADRMATAAFAMGEKGVHFIEQLPGYEAYMITRDGIATETTGWRKYQVAV